MTRDERLAADNANDPILFYGPKNAFGTFSNFSPDGFNLPHPFTGERTWYATGEHRYQAMKATTQVQHDWVNLASSPGEAKKFGRQVELRQPWGETYASFAYYVMLETVLAKFTQSTYARRLLEDTVGQTLYEDSPTDDIWGWRFQEDHRGKNLLGVALMQARSYITASRP